MKELRIEVPEGYEIDKEKSTFEKIVFKPLKKDTYPETWEKCIEKLKNKNNNYYYIDVDCAIRHYPIPVTPTSINLNLLTSKEIAEKFLILQKLYTCRQAYIDDWKPNWNDGRLKYIISVKDNEIFVDNYYNVSRKFIFPTLEMAKEFLKNFKDDLEKIKDLL